MVVDDSRPGVRARAVGAGVSATDEETIYPTHRCFDDVTDFLNDLAKRGAQREQLIRYTVVHGIMLAPDGTPFAHAWLEQDDAGERIIIQGAIYKGERGWLRMTRSEFLERSKVWDETRYTLDECLHLDRVRGPGPWVPEYRRLCGNERREWRPACGAGTR